MIRWYSSLRACRLRLILAGGALALLAGCVAVPVGGYVVGDPVAYPADGSYPAYGAPVYASPWYWGPPAVSLGFYGRFGGGRRGSGWHHHDHGGGHWAPGHRPGRGGGDRRGGGGWRR